MFSTVRAIFEYLGGERDDAPSLYLSRSRLLLRCAVWIFAIVVIYVFSGQSSKFIYIDF